MHLWFETSDISSLYLRYKGCQRCIQQRCRLDGTKAALNQLWEQGCHYRDGVFVHKGIISYLNGKSFAGDFATCEIIRNRLCAIVFLKV
jgi:hypothetical protein